MIYQMLNLREKNRLMKLIIVSSGALVRKQLSVAAQQTKIRHTSPEKIKNCQVFLPDVSTQIKISNLLDAIEKSKEWQPKSVWMSES